ncbi:uncharacterized protein RAG0_08101 [Rhynchosporium agropyri]|uniref:Uncharacterized protein n=1 Tax=Rhynchosporium agropyri TaxID=914238 RepID=A0A1E1KP26_9HELO|nr:uncharacterized protein RAG0_08101 [Rhynchosporium agropyri]
MRTIFFALSLLLPFTAAKGACQNRIARMIQMFVYLSKTPASERVKSWKTKTAPVQLIRKTGPSQARAVTNRLLDKVAR